MAITSFSSSTGQTNLEKSSDETIPIEITQLANDLAENILTTMQQQAESTITMNDENILLDKLTQLETSYDNTSTL
ncbi:unnamed protein product, partial [Rotaria magnacalcarata]